MHLHLLELEDRFAEFIEVLRGQSEHNRRNYTHRLRAFLDTHRGKPAAAITSADVNAWHRTLQRRRLAPATLSGYRQALKAFFNYCVTVGDIDRSPAAHLIIGSFASDRSDVLPVEADVQAVTELAYQWIDSGHPQRTRDGLIWLLSLYSGPRLGEIRNLLLDDVAAALRAGPDAHGVYRAPSFGKTKRAHIRFAAPVDRAFRAWLALRPPIRDPECFTTTRPTRSKSDPVPVCRALTHSAATHIYESICAAAGVTPPILSHALRHRLGDTTTRLYGPKVAAILLNHRDWQQPNTAIAFYHHPDESDASRAVLSSANGHQDMTELAQMRRFFGLD